MGTDVIGCDGTDKSGARGEMTCVHMDGRSVMARHRMSPNVPMLLGISDDALSSVTHSRQPSLHARLVHAHVGLAVSQP